MKFGILGQIAPELTSNDWIGSDGKETAPFRLGDHPNTVRILYCFQSWCPGCHSAGFPTLKQLTDLYKDTINIKFAVIQTVFEGHRQNGPKQRRVHQSEYDLALPFGQDQSYPRPDAMTTYRTGGTPWFIFINRAGEVIYNDYHVDLSKAKNLIDDALTGKAAPTAAGAILTHRPENSYFKVAFPEGATGQLSYRRDGETIFILHTEITGNQRGKGLGSWMMELVLEEIERLGLRVKPICSFAVQHLSKYQRWAPLLK